MAPGPASSGSSTSRGAPPEKRRHVSDALPLVAAAAVVGGAWVATPVPVGVIGSVGLAGAALAAAGRSRTVGIAVGMVVAALAASTLSAHAWAALEPPPPRRYVGTVTLVSDPEPVPGGVRVDVKAGSRRSELWAKGSDAASLRAALAGERVEVAGWLEPARDQPWLHRRHIATRLTVEHVGPRRVGSAASQVANAVRRTLQRGADHLTAEHRGLYLGLVLGDDRDQSDELVETFRAAGLTHLMVVSGQNVAFVLTLAAPVLSRLQLRGRLVSTVGVLVFFALLTRFEPSVLRATVMAGLAATAVTVGRPASRLRLLALAVILLVLVDPFLVRSAGFALSVAACVGIIVLTPRIEAHLRGPRIITEPLAVTLGAQIGVAPLLIPLFGGMPIASIPANLLAGPAAGFVMMWGLTGGFVAGLAPRGVGAVVMVPTALGVGWIDGVARWAAALPLGQIDARGAVALGVLTAVVVVVRRRFWRGRRGV